MSPCDRPIASLVLAQLSPVYTHWCPGSGPVRSRCLWPPRSLWWWVWRNGRGWWRWRTSWQWWVPAWCRPGPVAGRYVWGRPAAGEAAPGERSSSALTGSQPWCPAAPPAETGGQTHAPSSPAALVPTEIPTGWMGKQHGWCWWFDSLPYEQNGDILQMIFSIAFSLFKTLAYSFEFHWNFDRLVQEIRKFSYVFLALTHRFVPKSPIDSSHHRFISFIMLLNLAGRLAAAVLLTHLQNFRAIRTRQIWGIW